MTDSKPRIAVVGPGRIGRGIALAFALAGHEVALIDVKRRDETGRAALQSRVRGALRQDLDLLVKAGALSQENADVIGRRCSVDTTSFPDASVKLPHDVYFEGVPEQLETKRACYAWLSEVASPGAILASSTSTLPVETMSQLVSHPERYLNAHWLNPAHLMPLVEVSPGSLTSPEVLGRLTDLLRSIGKVPVTCSSSPGYIVPRLQALAMNEAARMFEEGVASAEDIDRAVRVGFGVRYAVLGLLEFIDWGGGDILHHASEHLSASFGAERFAAPRIIGENMARARRGLRDGQGFYDFRNVDVEAYRLERMTSFIGLLRHLKLLPESLS